MVVELEPETGWREFYEIWPTVSFADILEKVEVVPDEHYLEPPWKSDDGFKHHLVDDPSDGQAAGAFRDWKSARKMVVLDRPEDWGNEPHYWNQGASRQVAFEMARWVEREAREQLAKWYSEGWEVYGVAGVWKDDRGEFSNSVWGIYGYDKAYLEETRRDIAYEIVADMEKKGYIITAHPKQMVLAQTPDPNPRPPPSDQLPELAWAGEEAPVKSPQPILKQKREKRL